MVEAWILLTSVRITVRVLANDKNSLKICIQTASGIHFDRCLFNSKKIFGFDNIKLFYSKFDFLCPQAQIKIRTAFQKKRGKYFT